MSRLDRCRRCVTLALVMLLWSVHPAAAQEARSITLTRPMEVGQKFDFRAEAMLNQKTSGTMGGEIVPNQSTKVVVRFESEFEVREVDAHGRPLHAVHTIRKCVVNTDGYEDRLAAPGATMVARVENGDTTISLDGEPVDEQLENVFEMLANVDESVLTEDQLFGSAEPRRPGESWPANLDNLYKELERQSETPISRDGISGNVTFVEERPFGERDCLLIGCSFTTENSIPGLELPPGMTLESGRMEAEFQGLFPVDVNLPCLFRSIRMDITADVSGRLGEMAVKMRSENHIVVNFQLDPVAASSGLATGETDGDQP